MLNRFLRTIGVLAFGCSFQLLGCQNQKIGEIVAGSIRTTAVDVGTFVIESAIDQVLGLN